VRWRVKAGLFVAMALAFAAPAHAAYAPVDQPGPPLDVPQAQLSAALQCTTGVDNATKTPVLLVPGTGSTPPDNFGWNYEPALTALGIPWCAVTLPEFANDDIQVNGEYVVYAIRTMHARAGRRISILGHSQGGMLPRWALRWWPDTRPMVDDVVGFAPSNHGTTQAKFVCMNGCSPADWQQMDTSHFIAALNSYQETFPGISYTDVYTHTDEVVEPNMNSNGSSSLHGGGGEIANVAVQDICPADPTEHNGLGTYDAVAYALAIDALTHDGPANPARISPTVCAQPFMPGVNPVTGPGAGLKALIDDETSPSRTVFEEPPLKCYVTASCPPATTRSAASCRSRTIVLHLRGRRIVAATVYLDGHRIKRMRGRHLRTVRLTHVPAHGFTLKLVTRSSGGARRVRRFHYGAC
jgi:triacylglycerol esterase/lipase EstA (alpha/beta hydrolase family)